MRERRRLIAANWKMHKVTAEAVAYVAELRRGLAGVDPENRVDVVLLPSAPLLARVADALGGFGPVALGAQDLHPEQHGAHTGDSSGVQLADAGCRFVLCGHSERRAAHGESDELVARKVAAACLAGLVPVLCVGETSLEREQGRTEEVLARQLDAVVDSLARSSPTSAPGLVVAYEPVWAIGTGRTATAGLAQDAHAFLRGRLERALGGVAERVRLLYGGSVKPDSCGELVTQPDIDGFLVGGASLDPAAFLGIIARCAR
jgi:triosephosphate isomerase